MKYCKLLFVVCLLVPQVISAQYLFKDVTTQAGITSVSSDGGAGVVVFDFDGDGWDDLYLPGGLYRDAIYKNNHDGTFNDITPLNIKSRTDRNGESWRAFTRGGIAFDYDNDGLPDLFCASENTDILWHNESGLQFSDATAKAHLDTNVLNQNQSMGATFGDFDGDGFNDFYVARWMESFQVGKDSIGRQYSYGFRGFPNSFYINNHNGTFTDRAKEFGVDADTALSKVALFFDYDRDGDLDLLVGNDGDSDLIPNKVYKNVLMETGSASFVDVSDSISMAHQLICNSIAPGDYNTDGNFDLFETNFGPSVLLENSGAGIFTNTTAKEIPARNGYERNGAYSTLSWTALFGDYDNDGNEDLFVLHGPTATRYAIPISNINPNPNKHDTSIFYANIGGIFTDYTDKAMTGEYIDSRGRGAAYLDFNHDGKMDICYGAVSENTLQNVPDFRILQNITPNSISGHWLEMRFTATRTAKEAIGTIVDVWAGGIRHSRQVSTGGGFASQNSLMQHVGLGKYYKADSIIVYWPADKNRHRQVDRYYDVKADTILIFGEYLNAVPINLEESSLNIYPNPVNDKLHFQNLPYEKNTIELFNMLGKKEITAESFGWDFSLPVSTLSSGCYIVQISSNGHNVVRRVLKR